MASDENRILRSKLSRRRLLRQSAAVGAGLAVGGQIAAAAAAPSVKDRFGARFASGGKLVFGLTNSDQPNVQALLDEYSQKNNVTIETQVAPYDPYYTKLNLDLTTGTGGFDVVSMDDPWMPQFAAGKFLASIQEMLDKRGQKVDPDFVPELVALGNPKGSDGLRAIPWLGNVQVFAWRTDVLDELKLSVPKTWDELLSNAKTVTDANKGKNLYGFGLRGQSGNAATTSFLPCLRGYGVDVFAKDNWEPQLTTPPAMQAIKTHLALKALCPPGVENVDHATNGRNVYSGLVAQDADIWPDLVLQIFDPKLSKVVGKVQIGAEPAQPGAKPVNMTGNWLLGIPGKSKNADAALDFILWFTAPAQQKRLLMEHNIPPSRISVLTDKEAVAKFPFLPGLLAAGRNALPRPRTPLYPQVEQIIGQYVSQAIAGQISGEDAMQKANKEIRDLMVREGQLK